MSLNSVSAQNSPSLEATSDLAQWLKLNFFETSEVKLSEDDTSSLFTVRDLAAKVD